MSNRPYLIDATVAFPTFDDSELVMLETFGTRRAVAAGEYLYREGDTHLRLLRDPLKRRGDRGPF